MNNRELARKIVHMITGIILITIGYFIHYFHGTKILSTFLLIVLIAFLLADWCIADLGIRIPVYKQLERNEERKGLHNVTHSILAALVCIQFFDIKITLFAFLILTFGDAAASMIDNVLGKKKQRSRAGIMTMFAVSFVIGVLIINSLIVILAMALTATLVEKYFRKVDDNLAIPIFSGLIGQIAMYFF